MEKLKKKFAWNFGPPSIGGSLAFAHPILEPVLNHIMMKTVDSFGFISVADRRV